MYARYMEPEWERDRGTAWLVDPGGTATEACGLCQMPLAQ